jgi:hypothetical protein
MNVPSDSTAAKGLHRWWQSPPRPGLQRLISPWEYRHLSAFGATRILGGGAAAGAGIICLAYDVKGWAAFFLVLGGANVAGGFWYISIARSGPADA